MTFLELAERVILESKQPLTANEIWKIGEEKGYNKELNSSGKTPWATLGAQLHVSARDNAKTPFAVIGRRPKRFYLKREKSKYNLEAYESEDAVEMVGEVKPSFLEKHLHPFLSYFAFYHLKCYTKTINHSKSTKREFGEWVHPDIVGCSFPIDEWNSEVLNLSKTIGDTPVKMISFELKRELSLGTLREYFFQTVSNSSWAHESYLVAANISNNDDFRSELSRLSTAFGIGVIRLDIEEPDSSEVIYTARTRDVLDWDTIDKLTMNKDFVEFIRRIRIDVSSSEIRKEKYDKVYDVESLKKIIG